MTDQGATMGGGMQGPAYEPSPSYGWVNSNSFASAMKRIDAIVATNPNVGQDLERVLQDYPSMSRDMAAGLAYAGRINEIPVAILDDLAEKDRRAQAAATEGGFWSAARTTVRGSILGMEDLYNVSPVMALPRLAINLHQGKSWDESVSKTLDTSLATQTRMNRLGLGTDYGEGWMPSEEIIPQGSEFFGRVKELIGQGEFSGSVEEQLLAASQQAMVEQARNTGLNPYAITRAQWMSTQLHRTINGVEHAVAYSPGAAAALQLTTPGTLAYAGFSGLVDATFRVTMEPVDIVFDNVGDAILGALRPQVAGDFMSFINRGSATMREVMDDFGVTAAYEPILTGSGQRAKAVSGPGVTEGVMDVTVDVEQTSRSWYQRVDEMDAGDNVWTDPTDPYAAAYVERGMGPDDVRDALKRQGGVEAENMLTIEHELVHAEVQIDLYDVQTHADGHDYIDTAHLSDKAPDEMRVISEEINKRNLGYERIAKAAEDAQTLDDAAKAAKSDVEALKSRLKAGVDDAGSRQKLTNDLKKAQNVVKKLEKKAVAATKASDELIDARQVLNGRMAEITEADAVGRAIDNMMDGSWSGPKMLKAYKKKAGLTNTWRPFVNPKSVTEWLQSKAGARTLKYLARTDDIETLRKTAGYLELEDLLRISLSDNEATIAGIIQDSFNSSKMAGLHTPTIGKFRNAAAVGLDGWKLQTEFMGGTVSKASTAMGRSGRRARVSVGNHILTTTNPEQTLDTIYSTLATIGVDAAEISKIQRKAIRIGRTEAGLDRIAADIERLSKERLRALDVDSKIYTDAEIDKIWSDWRGYAIDNRVYWVSNAGNERKWIFDNGVYREVTDADLKGMKSEAFMEAQFATTHRVMPDIRRFRRLHSKQRNAYERMKKFANRKPAEMGGWTPSGFDTTRIMHAGDATFGVWRDMNLMRAGWAMRIIPEEQLRFGATGYSGLFSNPLDYFISMMNRMDFSIGDDPTTLGEIMRLQEGLGTAALRDPTRPLHMVKGDDWVIAHRKRSPVQFWRGITREFVTSSHDEVTAIVARLGVEEAHAYFQTAKGQKTIKRIAMDAKKDSSLALVMNPKELRKYIDVVEHRISQMTGGEALWHNPVRNAQGKRYWVNTMDRPVYNASDKEMFSNIERLKQEIETVVVRQGGDPVEIMKGRSHITRAEAEGLLNEVRGYNLDELEELGHAAVVVREGNADLRRIIGEKQLDDIVINESMPLEELRALDKKVEEAFTSRGVEPPDAWQVPKGDLEPTKGSAYRAATDRIFELLNGIPSRVLNRQPFFQQAFGAKIAEAYYYGDSGLRGAIDELAASSDGFNVMFDLGKRQTFNNMGVSKFPKPFDQAKRMDPAEQVKFDPKLAYEDAIEQGMYDRVPLRGDPKSFITSQVIDALEQIDVTENVAGKARGIWSNRRNRTNKLYSQYPDRAFVGSDRVPHEVFLERNLGNTKAMAEKILEDFGWYYRSGQNADAIESLLLGFDEATEITTDLLRKHGLEADAADEIMSSAGSLERIRSIGRAMKMGDIPEAQAREIATTLGWKDEIRTSGFANSPERAWTYPMGGTDEDYVDIIYTPHLDPALQKHLAEEGDIEQLFTLDVRFPALHAIGQDFVDAFSSVRERTGWRVNHESMKTIIGDHVDMPVYFEVMDDIIDNMPPIGPATTRGYEANDEAMNYVYDQLQKHFSGPENQDKVDDFFQAMSTLSNEFAGSSRITSQSLGWWGNALGWDDMDAAAQTSEINRIIRSYQIDQSINSGISSMDVRWVDEDDALVLVEESLERILSRAERLEFSTLWRKRSYQPDENLVALNAVEPAARLQKGLVKQLNSMGVQVTSNTQVGDIALLFDRNLEPARFSNEPLLINQLSTELDDMTPHLDGTLDGDGISDAKLRRHIWSESLDDTDGLIKDEFDQIIREGTQVPDDFKQEFLMVDPDAGMGLVQHSGDIALWMSSPKFRSFVQASMDRTQTLIHRSNVALQKLESAGYSLDAAKVIPSGPTLPDNAKYAWDVPDELWESSGMADLVDEVQNARWRNDLSNKGSHWDGGWDPNIVDPYNEMYPEDFQWYLDELRSGSRKDPEQFITALSDVYVESKRLLSDYHRMEQSMASIRPARKAKDDGIYLANYQANAKVRESGVIDLDFDDVPQIERNEATQRVFGIDDGQNYDYMEIGSMNALPGQTQDVADELEELLKAAKYDSIQETKDIFYDLTNKSNIADAMKFIFPFGDAWYEVLSRWAHIMNPFEAGGQAFRNVRRVEQTAMAAKLSGFIETNEYGEEVFNWPIAPGMLANAFIPNEANVHLKGSMPISSLMFIDPTARGVGLPGMSPGVQISTQFLMPVIEEIPVFGEAWQWAVYGSKEEYRPGGIENPYDVIRSVLPTTMNRMVSAVFDEEHRESLGNIKFRLFESLGMTGNPDYDMTTEAGATKAWDVANMAGSWLGFLRILDAWFMPGQPQYSAIVDHPGRTEIVRERSDKAMTLDEVLEAAAEEDPEHQAQIVSVLRASNEYRLARELFTDAEAEMYMIERYDILPSMLQSASVGLLEVPVTWGGVQWLDDNDWLFDAAPLTLAATVPEDADLTYSSTAWNNLFSDVFELEGVENQPVRVKRSASELAQAVQRGAGYDQIRYQHMVHERAVGFLRLEYGESYASNDEYRARKDGLDRKLRSNIENIYTEFPIVKSQRQGSIVGSRNGIKVVQYVDEIKDIGMPGSTANSAFRKNVPHLADVAEQYAKWFSFLEGYSRLQEKGEASGTWWTNSESDAGERMRLAMAMEIEQFYDTLDNLDAKKYAKWLNQTLFDPLLAEWEWIDQGFAPELESYPSIQYTDTLPIGGP